MLRNNLPDQEFASGCRAEEWRTERDMQLGGGSLIGMGRRLKDGHAVRETAAEEIFVCARDVGEGSGKVKVGVGGQVRETSDVEQVG